MDNKKNKNNQFFIYGPHYDLYIYIYIYMYILLYLWGPGGPSIVILVPSCFPDILSPISICVKNNILIWDKNSISTSIKHFVHLIRVLEGGGGICHAYVDSSYIKVSANEDLIRVETYVQEGGQLTIQFIPQCEK